MFQSTPKRELRRERAAEQIRPSTTVGRVERRRARLLADAVVGIGGEVFADFEDRLKILVRADAAGDLRRGQGVDFFSSR